MSEFIQFDIDIDCVLIFGEFLVNFAELIQHVDNIFGKFKILISSYELFEKENSISFLAQLSAPIDTLHPKVKDFHFALLLEILQLVDHGFDFRDCFFEFLLNYKGHDSFLAIE